MTDYNQFLENMAKGLDIPPSKYQIAVERYQVVGKWLNDGEYSGCDTPPFIYPQGSFRLGTITRPWRENKEIDYDIDLVCELPHEKNNTTPKDVKQMVGKRLNENGNYERMMKKKDAGR